MPLIPLSDGIRLRSWTTGTPTAAPPVVLLHGGPGLWDYLEPVASMLADQTVVHRFDQRGCGGSDPSATQTMQRLQDDIEELRQHWGHERVVVLGHSFGAKLALTYAAACPDHVVKVGHCSGLGLGDWRTAYYEERDRRATPAQVERLTALQASRSPAEETEFRALSWFTDHADRDRAWQWALEDAAVPHPINFAANRALSGEVDAWSDAEFAALAASLTMPVWFVHGTGDPRPASAVQELAKQVPDHQVRLIEGAGHSPWRERPDAFRQVLKELLAG
ncbi:alpha/beta fold hydrolase [Kribbella sp. CA-293567]|uniref:alpha/beta fold hydrolase n=1 Tax=Kribbella sp. CA-293567 TaxID=3002436 RepID=UPI0022DD504B|nr:alpha/beta hydrolase [Kribbella sp. CA-293567]WBQ03639.1 alpha/beta hydrolase [Kribbella sp. CA-293567]